MIKLNEMMEILVWSIAVVCIADAITCAIVETIRLNRIRKITKECRELTAKVKNK